MTGCCTSRRRVWRSTLCYPCWFTPKAKLKGLKRLLVRHFFGNGILTALDDLSAGRIGALIKLFPVVSWLVKERPNLAVIQQILTHERIGIAFAKTNSRLCGEVNETLAALKKRESFDTLYRKWFRHLQEEEGD